MSTTLKRAVVAFLVITSFTSFGFAANLHYSFELVDQMYKMGRNVPISVRLTDTSTDKPVAGVTFSDLKLVIPGGQAMPSQIKVLTPDANGNYRFSTDLITAGDWQVDFMAKIPGEADLYGATLRFQVEK